MKRTGLRNPFVYGKVVGGDDFFDRESERARLLRLLSGRNNILLTGDRRVGKTSLLLRCFEELEGKNCRPFYFNLDPITSATAFIERYGGIFTQSAPFAQRAIGFLKAGLKGFSLDIRLADNGSPVASVNWKGPGDVAQQTIREVLNLPQELAGHFRGRFLICFDEFQTVKNMDGTDIVAEMRSSFQLHDKITYVFMGSEPGILGQMFDSPKEKFFSSAVKFHLGPIGRGEFTKFIQQKFAARRVDVPDDVCVAICEWGGDIPAHIQHICSSIWNFLPEDSRVVSGDLLNRVVKGEIEANDGLYLQIWQTIGDAKNQMLLHRLATVKGMAVSGSEFCAPLSMNPATVTRRLNKIATSTRGALIHMRSSGYAFSDPFFEIWISQKT